MRRARLVIIGWLLTTGCDLGGGSADQLAISGRLVTATARGAPGAAPPRRISHVMAVDPASATPHRALAPVASDGAFAIDVHVGAPYVLAFLDDSAVGADMVVALFRDAALDTLAPQRAGALALGDVHVDPATGAASPSIPYDALLAALGLDPAAAEQLGAVDDLSLRYANPDLDGDGVIDLLQDRRYALDLHVRAGARLGPDGRRVRVDDLTDRFLPTTGADALAPVLELTSIYALYPAAIDPTDYVAPGASALAHGGAFTATAGDAPAPAPTSFSALAYGDTRGFGPDYAYAAGPAVELPGAAGRPATLRYTLGALGRTLTFTNVVTLPRDRLTGAGTLAIFLRLVTEAGHYTRIDYAWHQRTAAGDWQPATAATIALAISGDGGHVSLHRAPRWTDEVGATIPPTPTGSIAWTWAPTGPAELCAIAVSFDDQLGLRHFVGGADANPGVTCAQ